MRDSSEVVIGAWRGVAGESLPRRELECVLHLAAGATHKTIARALGIAPGTVTKVVMRARDRLAVGNGAALVAEAVRLGIIRII
ncbi:hypothetical protein BJP27_24375 (plasmid) [Pseudomonas oryzihabitans]|nr:hypothetical protein BJP27_24375 [Pseudomonas psychrotolerans]